MMMKFLCEILRNFMSVLKNVFSSESFDAATKIEKDFDKNKLQTLKSKWITYLRELTVYDNT